MSVKNESVRENAEVNVFTAFLRAQSEGRFRSSGALAEAAGIGRSTAYRLLNETRPRLPKIPSSDVLEGLALVFPEVGLDRIREIAREATRKPSAAPGPLTRSDLRRAHTRDLVAEIQSRTAELEEGNIYRNKIKNKMIKDANAALYIINDSIFIIVDKHLGEDRSELVDGFLQVCRAVLCDKAAFGSDLYVKMKKKFMALAREILQKPGSFNAEETEQALQYLKHVRSRASPVLERARQIEVTAECFEDEPMLDAALNEMVEAVRQVGASARAFRAELLGKPGPGPPATSPGGEENEDDTTNTT
ncbi:hypothetical protein [Segniliparus rotundus]|uniref:hypothetical protein n=1 Tax=Segniliparus rotundus TaxID=286802 RepID=UPI0011D0D591|nr:hypothetical protein [Segniliparus rotundus]